MRASELLATPEEFWSRIEKMVTSYGLCVFEHHQRTHEICHRSIEDLKNDSTLGWQWDLWMVQGDPVHKDSATPAEKGWIQIDPPQIDTETHTITECFLGAQVDWLHNEQLMRNEALYSLLRHCRKVFFDKDKMQNVVLVWEPRYPNRTEKRRFTQGAVRLQNLGWSFKARLGGCKILLPDDHSRFL